MRGLGDDEDDEEEFDGQDQSNEDSNEDDDGEDVEPESASTSKKAKKAKATLSKTAKSKPTEDESESEEERWGKSKSAYYSSVANDVDSDDEEARAMEEAEARRLQAKARDQINEDDFGFEDVQVDAEPSSYVYSPHVSTSDVDICSPEVMRKSYPKSKHLHTSPWSRIRTLSFVISSIQVLKLLLSQENGRMWPATFTKSRLLLTS